MPSYTTQDPRIQAKLDLIARYPTMPIEERRKAFDEFRAEPPALRALERILYVPYSFEPLPLMLHYGYATTMERLKEVALDLGYKLKWDVDCDHNAFVKVLSLIIREVIDHPVALKGAFCEGKMVLVISLCTNWAPSPELEENVPKLKEYLGETEDPKWYLDCERWYCRYDL
ncbi:hypothetical protein CERSUDRAFT_76941 [Gelatoporia subvermispora B]|uniref:Uncharacterized protein n=1 Tax=Ceriporiopsis subvermispora (strain B) TaxID=914234 RepID=M2R4Z9_CERS8|nr:hypothetical protein CERSUDRAFT_76941 [Gelatoporia subvermispora B]